MVYDYLRVSTDKQDENNQRIGVADKAKKMGAPVDEYVIDSGVSGTVEQGKRKLGTLIKKLKPGGIIIASELSRLGRSLMMIMPLLERLMKLDVKVVTVKDNYVLGSGIQPHVPAFAFGISAQIERDMISQGTKEALTRKAGEEIILEGDCPLFE
jgi:DNA invertase Pin-like site-specific DNA recombinase